MRSEWGGVRPWGGHATRRPECGGVRPWGGHATPRPEWAGAGRARKGQAPVSHSDGTRGGPRCSGARNRPQSVVRLFGAVPNTWSQNGALTP